MTLLVSHFFRYSNKPRLFAASTVLASIAIFIFALPHFIYGSGRNPALVPANWTQNSTSKKGKYELCDGEDSSNDQCEESGGFSDLTSVTTGVLAIFITSELLQGIAQSPKFSLSITYMDDNAKKSSSKHVG